MPEAIGLKGTNDLPPLFKGKHILFLYSSVHDRYKTHRTSARVYANAYEMQGISSVFLDISDDAFTPKVLEALFEPGLLAVHCEQGWGLDLSFNVGGSTVDPYVETGLPAIAHIRDYPFYPWLIDKTLASQPNRLLHYTDASATDFAHQYGVRGPKQAHAFAPHIYLDHGVHSEDIYRSREDRDIDLLYVGSYSNPSNAREKFLSVHKGHSQLFDDLIDLACSDFHGVYWEHAEKVALSHDIPCSLDEPVFQDLLVTGSEFIRYERRRRLLGQLAPHPMYLVWSGDPPNVSLHPDTVLVSGTTFPETLDLMSRSKAMAMCLNNFSCSVSERLLSCMHRGAAVLCHGNTLIDSSFRDGKTFFRLDNDFKNVTHKIECLEDGALVENVTQAARTLVMEEYSPEIRVRQFLSSIASFYQEGQ